LAKINISRDAKDLLEDRQFAWLILELKENG